ncbi:MAG: cytochrome b N-terminal domain-containing protein [Candidatus Binataceae bacterium]
MNLVKSAIDAFEERTGLVTFSRDLAQHPIPPGADWYYVFGSAVLICFIMQIATGTALATRYISSTGSAYHVLQFISTKAVLGNLLRGMHFFGASAMILLIGIHMIQVFLMGCYKYPRELNWITGVCLLFLTLAMGFTGQLLRWDQTAVWATILAAEMIGRMPVIGRYLARFLLGGKTLSGASLSRFFAYHVFYLPAAIIGLLLIHLYLVFHDGISAPPVPGEKVDPKTYHREYDKLLREKGVPFWPDGAWRDVVFGALVVAIVVILAATVGPPHLGKPPNPSLLANEPRPDWYFVWYFAVLALLPRGAESTFMILAPLCTFVFLLLMPVIWNKGERHPARRPWAVALVILVVITMGSFWIEGAVSPWSPRFDAKPLPIAVVGKQNGPAVIRGAQLFHDHACEFCHTIGGYGGLRGPNLSLIGDTLTPNDIRIRILAGGGNMPAFAGTLTSSDLNDLMAFLLSRKASLGATLGNYLPPPPGVASSR